MVPAAGFEVSGNVTFYEWPADSGNMIGRGFCAACGSPVCSKNAGMPDLVFVGASALDDPERVTRR